MRMRRVRPLFGIAVMAVALLLPTVITSKYLFHLLMMAVIWSILAVSLNLVVGYTGLLSVAHGALFGLGGYTSALLVIKLGWNFWVTVPAAMLMTALIGAVLGLLTLRLKGHYFAISTLSFGMIISLVLEKWEKVTEGPRGLSAIPAPSPIELPLLGTLRFVSNDAKFYVALGALALCMLISYRILHSPIGRALEAIRQNELVASCLAVDPVRYKLMAFAVSAAMAGLAGVLYSAYITYLNPADAGFMNGFYGIMYVVIGGMGTFWGPLVGAFFMVSLPELLRTFQEFRLLILGVLLILTITFLPHGIVGGVSRLWHRYWNSKESQSSSAA